MTLDHIEWMITVQCIPKAHHYDNTLPLLNDNVFLEASQVPKEW